MRDGNKLLPMMDCKYGAPMGRMTIKDNPTAVVRLFKVRMVDGCYDVGGAYWGIGNNPLYACIGEGFQAFTRAPNRKAAKANISQDNPELSFKR